MAVNFPNGGEISLMRIPETKYQPITRAGPSQPTNSANFLEKRKISKIGFVKLR